MPEPTTPLYPERSSLFGSSPGLGRSPDRRRSRACASESLRRPPACRWPLLGESHRCVGPDRAGGSLSLRRRRKLPPPPARAGEPVNPARGGSSDPLVGADDVHRQWTHGAHLLQAREPAAAASSGGRSRTVEADLL